MFITFAIVLLLVLYIKALRLYRAAKQKHRDEWIRVYWFIGSFYGKTCLVLPRALYPLFTVFNGKAMGFTCAGVRIHIQNTKKEFLLCSIEKDRQTANYLWDLGVGGVISYNHTVLGTVREELEEEISISMNSNTQLIELQTVTPAKGYHCIVYNYLLKLPDEFINQFISRDGTYEGFKWISMDEMMKLNGTVREDPFNYLVNDF